MSEGRDLVVQVARAYYESHESKVEIAARLGLSRFKVARLLQRALREGVVQIRIIEPADADELLGQRLAEHLGLRECVVVPGANGEEATRTALARAAATYVSAQAAEGTTIGFSWGRTVGQIGAYVGPLPGVRVVALTGAVGADFSLSPVGVFRSVSAHSDATTLSIFAPIFVDSPLTAAALRRDTGIAAVLETYDSLSLAVVSIGSWDPPVTQLLDTLTAAEKSRLTRAGARAELLGLFIDDDGALVDCGTQGRRISVSPEQLRRTPRVLGVAGGSQKVPAVRAVACSGLLTSLVTDRSTAQALLDLPAAPLHTARRSRRPV